MITILHTILIRAYVYLDKNHTVFKLLHKWKNLIPESIETAEMVINGCIFYS